ncbi:MAG: GNAT family N-acetyltransferase [Chloroflexi bacterium]|nr:GNAT family N-acetyltransferase [Chloroflexota bacterium]MCI0580828.1 GNAT family N-acetyltransferase [Chloroflexota bacterium]MCI0648178.1 GNAT family N-acetyltransferase [Chloroflexota bacterium]MCI0730320.1 GNAT family N-acetyltransferase [Chloroflexota bacterium]
MNIQDVLTLYDKEQRIDVEFPGVRREVLPHVVRFVGVDQEQDGNFVLYSKLDGSNADAVIDEQIAYFGTIGRSFEWKLYDHDTPADLKDRLQAHGLAIGEAEAIMALDLREAPATLLAPVTADVRRISEPAQLPDVVVVQEQVWGKGEDPWLVERLTSELRDYPDFTSVYVAYADGAPACSAWINLHPNSHFASLWGGSTLPQYRRRGLYTALLASRVQEAIRRGYRFLTIDASPMSRPIVAHHGFHLLTMAYPCNWESVGV